MDAPETIHLLKEAWTAVGPLLGTVVGGAIGLRGTRATLRQQREQERERRQLGKYEAIHEGLTELSRTTDGLNLLMLRRLSQGTPYPAGGDGGPSLTAPAILRLRMLVEFYAPGVLPDIVLLEEHAKTLGALMGESVKEGLSAERRADLAKTGFDTQKAIVTAADEGKRELAALAAEFTRPSDAAR
jgi:hypothetical protein